MKILFSNFPWWANENGRLRIGIRAGSRWPFTRWSVHQPDKFEFGGYLPVPFFMVSAAAYAKREIAGAEVTFRDSIACGESYLSFYRYLDENEPDWLVMESATPSYDHDIAQIAAIKDRHPNINVILCGTIVAGCNFKLPFECIAAVKGEYEKNVVKVIRDGARGIVDFDLLTTEEMNALPYPMLDEVAAYNYADGCPAGQRFPHLQVWTSRGCPFKCLAGDTPVNTVEGMIPIRELVGRDIGVFTYDPVERRGRICTARNIRQYGTDKLLRVHFDDGTHIDCTPDHEFLAFKWGNQHTGEKEWRCEAKDLKPGMHLRALKTSLNGPARSSYWAASWSRRGQEKVHRMIAEWMLGRRLASGEQVHHKDGDRLNNAPRNLMVCASAKEHFVHHPEISERMRSDNPTKNGIGDEWRGRISAALRGVRRTPEQCEKYRLAAIAREARKTPEQKRLDAERMQAAQRENGYQYAQARKRGSDGRFEPADIMNHRVVCVEPVDGEHPVYCLEVPETGWFYANNVLLKNCVFCGWPGTMTGNDPEGANPRKVRGHSPEWVEGMLLERLAIASAAGKPYRSIYIDDDTFNLTEKHTLAISEVMKRIGLPWSAMCRADTISRKAWQVMKDAGCFGVKIGFESGSQRVVDQIINKRLNIKEAAETARFLRSIGLSVHGTFTVGMPGETDDEKGQTLTFIAELYQSGAIDTHQLSGTAVIEGTPMANLIAGGVDLPKYPGAHVTPSYRPETDGQLKIEHMRR